MAVQNCSVAEDNEGPSFFAESPTPHQLLVEGASTLHATPVRKSVRQDSKGKSRAIDPNDDVQTDRQELSSSPRVSIKGASL